MKNIIPKDKFDMEAAERLQQYSIEEIKEEIPKLLEWLQDYNWLVAHPVSDYFSPHINTISDELVNILRGNDGIWKYWIISLVYSSPVAPNSDLVNAIKHLAENPSRDDIDCEVDIEAQEFMEEYYKGFT